ncbi:MAG TPA: molecular chaperone TorD family protein [Syntrophorhabdaceae bacterium]|nr:molecular chaperone TorD family protein [Syntrophorhabdaceae bacterium]HOT41365.1 molecular chaperone TorD family protein [Syntrophorhabdaceae bacterium]HPC66657.1 molecular chaperone TorD family protein [Syntrophorhabdaceae bacterium]HQE79463.1 molecular chaperone TorD family protein [Syntrophorhabdaceae bacterium]HQH44314.1 molecular chaperone TorD family protein [Syntrophorhabdaceae bacterium]
MIDYPVEAIKKRLIFYNALVQAFNYPDAELANNLSSGKFSDILHTVIADGEADLSGIDFYKDRDKNEVLLELERDYTWMFFASKPRVAYLFGSVYGEGKLYQDSTFKIARLYHETGLNVKESFGLPPDHIAVELEFMAYIAFNFIDALKNENMENVAYAEELERHVFDNYLSQFAIKVGETLKDRAKTEFYRNIGEITALFFSKKLHFSL